MRVFWIYRGKGEVFLPKGYRTQEGDGVPLPAEYKPDAIHADFADSLRLLKDRLASVSPAALVPVQAIVGRSKGDAFSHVVNIPKETSPSRFHPPKSIDGALKKGTGSEPTAANAAENDGREVPVPLFQRAAGGMAQREMYLVLDPQTYKLNTWGRSASIIVFPDLRDLSRYEQHPLEPGMVLYLPPGTGHRGLDAFVNVLTIPGFKPHNEFYIDRDIRDLTAGKSPYNENLLDSKNYEKITDFL